MYLCILAYTSVCFIWQWCGFWLVSFGYSASILFEDNSVNSRIKWGKKSETELTHHHYHHQSLNLEGRLGTTDDFATTFFHFTLFSTALWDLPNSRPVHSLMLSSHLFLCPPCRLPPFSVPCKMVLARPDERETWPYHCSLHLFTIVRRSSCGPVACWILARTSSLYERCSILW